MVRALGSFKETMDIYVHLYIHTQRDTYVCVYQCVLCVCIIKRGRLFNGSDVLIWAGSSKKLFFFLNSDCNFFWKLINEFLSFSIAKKEISFNIAAYKFNFVFYLIHILRKLEN